MSGSTQNGMIAILHLSWGWASIYYNFFSLGIARNIQFFTETQFANPYPYEGLHRKLKFPKLPPKRGGSFGDRMGSIYQKKKNVFARNCMKSSDLPGHLYLPTHYLSREWGSLHHDGLKGAQEALV